MIVPRTAARALGVCALAGAAALTVACRASAPLPVEAQGDARSASVEVPPPLPLQGTAYDAAGLVPLPEVPPGNYPGLHNVYRLSGTILSGSEPIDEEALAQLAAWGVKTILSVDGKVPDSEGAAREGLRYVHVPIQYKGIDDDQIARIAKTFRELEGPFYVHCFHGRHRGPAAAAIGRVAVDGLSRDRAIAEMRQWCSTAQKYEGLYATVATADIPTAAETEAYEFDFTAAHAFGGFREAMVAMARISNELDLVRDNDWRPDPAHPDVDPLQSATQLHQFLVACSEMDEMATYPDSFAKWMDTCRNGSGELVELLTECRAEKVEPESLYERIDAVYDAVSQSCLDCHGDYRNR
ncbi:MAG: hypothetical protein AAF726_02115 [Planctomycetota bacterium]